MNPLDAPLAVTFFADQTGSTVRRASMSLHDLADLVMTTTAPVKTALPWLKLATFGDTPTPIRIDHDGRRRGGSLRSNGNVLSISGIEADYDLKAMSMADAAAALTSAGIAALLYTSPSSTPAAPKWRVLCPCSAPLPPAVRADLVGRLNTILGGVLADESFTLSQAYFYGAVDPTNHALAYASGDYIDRLHQIPPRHPVRAIAEPLVLPTLPDGSPPDAHAAAALTAALGVFSDPVDGMGRHQQLLRATNAVAPFILSGHMDEADVTEALEAAMVDSGRAANPGEVASALGGALRIGRPYEPPTYGAEFDALPAPPPPPRGRLRVLSPGECEGVTARPYVVKGLLAEGDVGCLFGPPGAGKSLLAPLLAYQVAQGVPFFGLRTKPGPVLYVAAEDESGMKRRVNALLLAHGAADAFGLVKGVSDLLSTSSADLADLLAEVERRRPALIVIDTLAMAFPGLIENDADGMGRVVAVARQLARRGAAVLLVHHDTKAQGGTPRGHSLLNGALDMAIALEPRDQAGIIRGRLTKNRNGSCDADLAFHIGVTVLGTDQDGDDVTAARAVALTVDGEAPARQPKLSAGQTAALEALKRLMVTKAEAASDGTPAVPEAAWLDAWVSLSTGADARARMRCARSMRANLAGKGVIEMIGDMCRPTASARAGNVRGMAQSQQNQAGNEGEWRRILPPDPGGMGNGGEHTLKECSPIPHRGTE